MAPSSATKSNATINGTSSGVANNNNGPLREEARTLLQNFVTMREATGEFLAVDVIRVLHEEAHLLYETQCIRDLFDQDPFKCYTNDANVKETIQQFQKSLQVTSCHRLEMGDNYCSTEAVVRYNPPRQQSSPFQKKQKRFCNDPVEFHFKYERQPATEETATCIFYSIDLSRGYGPKQSIVVIRVWADDNKPSRLPAVSIDVAEGTDDDDWEDMDTDEEDDEVIEMKPPKSPKSETVQPSQDSKKEKSAEDEETRDRYACFVDPDVLQMFLECTQLTSLDEGAAFFTLMTFPYYQHEWDLVGFVLDSVFGYDEEDGVGDDGQ